jgi:hypothetical protein
MGQFVPTLHRLGNSCITLSGIGISQALKLGV